MTFDLVYYTIFLDFKFDLSSAPYIDVIMQNSLEPKGVASYVKWSYLSTAIFTSYGPLMACDVT